MGGYEVPRSLFSDYDETVMDGARVDRGNLKKLPWWSRDKYILYHDTIQGVKTIELEFDLTPEVLTRARLDKAGRVYDPNKKKKQIILAMCREELKKSFGGYHEPVFLRPQALDVHFVFGMKMPKWSKKMLGKMMGRWQIVRPDLSNMVKLYEDALQGCLWEDDCMISRFTAEKVYTPTPLIRLRVSVMDNPEELFYDIRG